MDAGLLLRLKALPKGLVSLRSTASAESLELLEHLYQVTFPKDYRDLKRVTDGLSCGNGGSWLELELASTPSRIRR